MAGNNENKKPDEHPEEEMSWMFQYYNEEEYWDPDQGKGTDKFQAHAHDIKSLYGDVRTEPPRNAPQNGLHAKGWCKITWVEPDGHFQVRGPCTSWEQLAEIITKWNRWIRQALKNVGFTGVMQPFENLRKSITGLGLIAQIQGHRLGVLESKPAMEIVSIFTKDEMDSLKTIAKENVLQRITKVELGERATLRSFGILLEHEHEVEHEDEGEVKTLKTSHPNLNKTQIDTLQGKSGDAKFPSLATFHTIKCHVFNEADCCCPCGLYVQQALDFISKWDADNAEDMNIGNLCRLRGILEGKPNGGYIPGKGLDAKTALPVQPPSVWIDRAEPEEIAQAFRGQIVPSALKWLAALKTIARCEALINAICGDKEPEEIRDWESDSVVEASNLITKTLEGVFGTKGM